MNAYQKLKDRYTEIGNIFKAKRILSWDMQVMMPPDAAAERASVMGAISAVLHEKETDPRIGEWLEQSESFVENEWDRRNLELMKNSYFLLTKIPAKLVKNLEQQKAKATMLWRQAKQENNWLLVQPAIESVYALTKEKAAIHAEIYGGDLYDSQLGLFSRGNRQSKIAPLFALVEKELPSLVREITEKQNTHPAPVFPALSTEKQLAIGRELAGKIGYTPSRGRLDKGVSAFNSGTRNDGRIVSRFSEDKPTASLYSTMHEAGHAFYNWHIPEEWDCQPVGVINNELVLHESQALILQRQAGMHPGFIGYLHGLIEQHAPEFTAGKTSQDLITSLQQVKPGYIRVDADEVTYPLHILLRYDVEKKLFSGEMAIADIPEYWNERFRKMMGLEVTEPRLGCLQDVHWCKGLFGYFPTYTQGAIYAAQLFAAMKKAIPTIDDELAQGDLSNFNQWLNQNVHHKGRLYDAPDLLERATGEPPNAQYFLDHLKNRYL